MPKRVGLFFSINVPMASCRNRRYSRAIKRRIGYLEAVLERLVNDGGHSGHVLVGRVGAASDQAVLDLQRPVVLLGGGALRINLRLALC